MIEDIKIAKAVNSAGKEALKVSIKSGDWYSASPPCGTSRGEHEAKDVDFPAAKSLLPVVKKNLIGTKTDYREVDRRVSAIDGTKNFSHVGGNLALGLSVAAARAQTKGDLFTINGKKARFPYPLVNVIGGGKHGGNTDFQEFLILPYREKTFHDAHRKAHELWLTIGKELRKRKLLISKNLENAWITKMDERHTLTFLKSLNLDVKIGMDCAASSFWDGKQYVYAKSKRTMSRSEHFEFIESIVDEFDIFYAEDCFHEDDFEAFTKLNRKFKKRLVVGDDLTTTNPLRFAEALRKKSISGIIVKPNQVGNLTLTEKVVEMAHRKGVDIIPSHRSSETVDNWTADLCIAWGAKIFKSGIAGMDAPKLERLEYLWKKIPGAKMGRI
jgi:enolase